MNSALLRVRKPLTLRLLKRVLSFSALLIVLLAGARAWWEYQGTLVAVHEEFAIIESTKAKSVTASLWDFDREQLALHVEGIRHFRFITYASVRDASGVVVQSGMKRSTGVLDREFPLFMAYNGQRQDLGVLHVQADLESLRRAAWNAAKLGLAYNTALVLLVAGLLFWLTSNMISRHLAAVAAHLDAFSLGGGSKPLVLDKRPAGDELDVLASALNTMQDGLAAAYGQVLAAQAEVRSLARFPLENPSPVLRAGAGGVLLTANPASTERLGVHVGQQLPDEFVTMISRALASGEVQHFESNFDGRAFAFAARPLPTEGYANIYGLDITERKAAANALRKSEARIRALFNATSDSAILMDTEGVILAINEHGAKRRGLNPEDMLGHLIYDHLPQDAAETRRRQTSEALRTGNPNTFEEQRGGFFYSITIYPILDADGTARQLASFSRDITAQKQSEQALRESEATFRAMVETVPLAIYLSTGVEQVSEYVNPTFVTLFGYTLEDVPTAAHWWPLAYPDAEYRSKVVGEWTRRVTRAIETQTAIDPMEAVCTCKDGSQKTISWGYIALGSRNYAYGLDLTERKRAEEALRRQVLALTQPLDSPASIRFTDLFNLEDIQRIQDTFAESMNVASIITTPDGVPLTNPSNFCRLCRDIIRKTEKGLANCYASDAVLGRLNLDGPTIKPCLSGGLWDAGASISVGGQHIANWLIGQVKNQAQDEDAMLRYADEIGADAEEFRAALAEVPVMSSEQFGRVAKALFLMSSELSLRAYQNAQQARFIHARQQAEEEVRRNNARLQGLVRVLQHKTESVQELLDNSLSEALALSGSRFGYIYHYSEERREFVLNTWSGEVMAECTVKAAPQVYQLAKTGIWGEAVRQRKPIVVNDFQAANPLKRGYPEGHVQLSNFMTVPVFQGGRIVAVAGVGNKNGDYQDADVLQLSLLMDACWQVAARLEAEHSVRRERVFADALLNSVPGLVYLYDDQGRLVRWNKSHETITGYSSGELSQMHLLDWYQGDPDAIERITKAIERVSQDGAGVEEALLQTKDGRRIPFYFSAVRLEIEGRGYFTGIGIDITERRQSEEEIRRSLHEKEILLKEIHHRVKNNLQIISSLLFLQAEYVIEPLDRTMFEESQKRISAMALVHEELYGSNDLSSVSMGDYVPRLVERVVASSDVSVQVEFDVEDMRLPVTRSIPCGLVLNEMVMNAVKHAFRNGRQGRLRVSLARRGGQVELAVEDNGPGLPPDFDLESPATLGLTLISSLARQLAGSVTAQSLEAGARFVLVFPVEEL